MSSNRQFRDRYQIKSPKKSFSPLRICNVANTQKKKCLVKISDLPEYWCHNLCDANGNFIFDYQHNPNVAKILSRTNFRVSDRNFLCKKACLFSKTHPFWNHLISDDGEECYLYQDE